MPLNLKDYCREKLESARDLYLQDWDAMSAESLTQSPGGVGRSPLHFTYEVALINVRLATRLRGEDPGPFDVGAWEVVPSEFSTPLAMRTYLKESTDLLISNLESIPESELDREIPTPTGSTTPFQLATFAATHMTYHDGQLNLIQALDGDAEIHWS